VPIRESDFSRCALSEGREVFVPSFRKGSSLVKDVTSIDSWKTLTPLTLRLLRWPRWAAADARGGCSMKHFARVVWIFNAPGRHDRLHFLTLRG
jgi:hypothetical protein